MILATIILLILLLALSIPIAAALAGLGVTLDYFYFEVWKETNAPFWLFRNPSHVDSFDDEGKFDLL